MDVKIRPIQRNAHSVLSCAQDLFLSAYLHEFYNASCLQSLNLILIVIILTTLHINLNNPFLCNIFEIQSSTKLTCCLVVLLSLQPIILQIFYVADLLSCSFIVLQVYDLAILSSCTFTISQIYHLAILPSRNFIVYHVEVLLSSI